MSKISRNQCYNARGPIRGQFDQGMAQYSTPNFFDQLFLIGTYCNPNSKKRLDLEGLAGRGNPERNK